MRSWRLRSWFDPVFRDLTRVYNDAISVERQILGTIHDLATQLETQIDAASLDLEAIDAIDQRMQQGLLDRASQADARLAVIRKLSGGGDNN